MKFRKDTDRITQRTDCTVYFNSRTFGALLLEISTGGCRISTDVRIPSGVTIDISTVLAGRPVLLTGIVINSDENTFGLSLLAIGESNYEFLNRFIENPAPADAPTKPRARTPRRILALGAGGGKILAQLKMLDLLEQEIGVPLLEYFDAFAGVSSGALLLAHIVRGRSIASIRETLVAGIGQVGFAGLFSLKNLINKNDLHEVIDREFRGVTMGALEKPIFTISRNFITSLYKYYSSWEDPEEPVTNVLKKATAIPVLMGVHEGEMDGAVGLFVNPVELLLRYLRHRSLLTEDAGIIYLDSGFDPLKRQNSTTFFSDNIVSQLLWAVGVMQRDLNLLANDRIHSEFPEVVYESYFFTYSRNYDLANQRDYFLAEQEVAERSATFAKWARRALS